METKCKSVLTLILAFLVQITFAQERTISGTVSDDSGPLPGVSVLKKGTTQGTETDFDGNYKIQTKKGDVLVFSFVGMETVEKTVGGGKSLNVTLKSANVLDEVVVTALGIKREKKSLGYASQEIKSDALKEGTTNTGNVASQLSGKVAGLNVTTTNNFGGSSNLLIRGIKSLGGGNPLIVIDGSPVNNSSTYGGQVDYGNALSDINQDDIASLNILKGAAASALYGERGLNGVIVITTKNGRSNEDDKSWGITLSSGVNIGVIDKSTFPTFQKRYGAGYGPFYSSPDHLFGYADVDGDGTSDLVTPLSEDGSWGAKFDTNKLVYQWDAFDKTSKNYGKATPWVAAKNDPSKFFETAFTLNNGVSLEKGSKGKNIAFTYDNFHTEGIMPNSKLDRNNFSLKTNYDLTEKLHTSFYGSLTFQNTRGRNISGYDSNLMSMFRQWWQVNVDILEQKDAYFRNKKIASEDNRFGNVSWNRKSSTNSQPAFWNNPYFELYENYSEDKRFRTFNYAKITYDFNDNLSLTGKASLDRSNLEIENRIAVGSVAKGFGLSGNEISSGYSRKNIIRQEVNLDAMLNYNFKLSDNIGVTGVLGGNIRKNYFNYTSASTEGGLVVPGLYALSNSKKTPLATYEKWYKTETNSGYITASFDFYKKFYLDATYRVDRSSTLPEENNVYSYPSVTGALILSEFFKPNWLSFWKVRANYAEVGATADPYELQNTYTSVGLLNEVGIYGTNYTKKNPNLKPQRSKEFEVGTEFNLFKNRLTVDVAYYNTKTFDQIVSLPVSAATGYTKKVINAGQINNTGFEAQVGIVPVRNDDFTWNVDLNWSTNKNKVVELYGDSDNFQLDSYQGGVTLNAYKGEAWGTLIGSGYKLDKQGNKILEEYAGGKYAKYAQESNKKLGNVTPDWIGGIRNSFKYKNLSFSFLIDFRKGGKIFSTDMYYGLATGIYKETAEGNVRETGRVLPGVLNGKPNTLPARPASYFGAYDGYKISPAEAFVYDGSFIKLREASISYSLPKKFLGKSIDNVKLSLVGRNLWIIHKKLPYADPEAMVGGGTRAYGWSVGSTPTTRDIGFNVSVKF